MKNSNLDLEKLIQGFIFSCKVEAKSPRTIEWYQSFLIRFRQYLVANGSNGSIGKINATQIKAFINYLQTSARTHNTDKPLSGATVQAYVRTLKAFFAWAKRENYLKSNPMSSISMPKAEKKILSTFTAEQISKLTSVCLVNKKTGFRNLVMIMLMLDSGLRVSELVNLRLEDICLSEGNITVHKGKGNKERLVPIGSVVQKMLWKYINQERTIPLTTNITYLFLSDTGLPIARNGVQQMLRRYSSIADITGVRVSPHTLRHTFAKQYLLNGGDLFSLQKILGHSSLNSVRTYVNLFASDVKKQHMRFSPVDNMVSLPGNRHITRIAIATKG